jgi:ribosomal protein L11 methyltransferase
MNSQHFTWRKLSAAKWEDVWPERLSQFADRLAITSLTAGKSIRVELFELSKKEAARVTKEFGGTVSKQTRDWFSANARPRAPIKVRGKLEVVTSSDERAAVKNGTPVLVIPAGMAFGTGEHATTLNCLRFLADLAIDHTAREWEMIDLGCGSGILALAARMLGAKRCLAGDFDPECVRATRGNLALNKLNGVTVKRLDVFAWTPDRTWDVVTANLYSTILTEIAPKLARSLAPGGSLIISGVMRDQEASVLKALAGQRLKPVKVARQGKWIAALLRRSTRSS